MMKILKTTAISFLCFLVAMTLLGWTLEYLEYRKDPEAYMNCSTDEDCEPPTEEEPEEGQTPGSISIDDGQVEFA